MQHNIPFHLKKIYYLLIQVYYKYVCECFFLIKRFAFFILQNKQ